MLTTRDMQNPTQEQQIVPESCVLIMLQNNTINNLLQSPAFCFGKAAASRAKSDHQLQGPIISCIRSSGAPPKPMDRPASRGLLAGGVQKAPTGLAVERPERPSTAARQQQQQGAPPGIAQSGRPLGISGSHGGVLGPPGTAIRRVTQAGGGQAQQIAGQAQARPLTQQGMGGLKPSTAAAGRQVLDRTYFINELRQKRQQIMAVIRQMQVCLRWAGCGMPDRTCLAATV